MDYSVTEYVMLLCKVVTGSIGIVIDVVQGVLHIHKVLQAGTDVTRLLQEEVLGVQVQGLDNPRRSLDGIDGKV